MHLHNHDPAPAMHSSHDSHHPHAQPDVLAAIREDLVNSREWVSRAIVLVYAALAGGSVVGFTWICDRALHLFSDWRGAHPWIPFLLTPTLCALIAWVTSRFVPGATGSGIPQVMTALHSSVSEKERHGLVSLKLAITKIGLCAGGLLGGLPIGREGPSVQIAAGVMLHARRWLPANSVVQPHALLVAGGAAGIAAAFNAPLAGVMFAIEELTRKIEQRTSGLVVAAIVLAGLIAVSAFGNSTYFGVIRVPEKALKKDAPEIQEAIAALDRGECVVIFPEGYLRRTEDRPLRRFGQGVWQILKARPSTPVFATWIEGGWGSYTSYFNGPPTKNKKKDYRRPIGVGMSAARRPSPSSSEARRRSPAAG